MTSSASAKPVAKNLKNVLDRQCKLRIRVLDISGPEGRPWEDLSGNPLKLSWNISRGNDVLRSGEVRSDGWIIAKLLRPADAEQLVLRIGPRSGSLPGFAAQPAQGLSGPETQFDWFEQYSIACEDHEPEPGEELPPLDKLEGVQARLNRLGYHAGLVDGVLGPVTEAALTRFQREHGLPVTGRDDDPTRDKLETAVNELEIET